MIINLGVSDVPYVSAPSKRQRKVRPGTVTTGDVAGFLERKYGVMQAYVDAHGDKMVAFLEQDIQKSLDTMAIASSVGAFSSISAGFGKLSGAMSKIEDDFKQFISSGEVESVGIVGVPTQAALDRRAGKKRSARFKRRRAGTGQSFVDSGLYVSSFRAWTTTGENAT